MTDNTRTLSPGALACRECGDEVRHPKTVEIEHPTGRVVVIGRDIEHEEHGWFEVKFSRCPECVVRRAAATRLLALFPRIRRSLGSKSYALDAIDAALIVLDALKVKPKEVARLLSTERDVRLALAHLAKAGAAARWSTYFLPIIQRHARDDSRSAKRWAALSSSEAQDLRDAHAAFLAARLERPGVVPVPDDADVPGCLLCGVGSITASPSAWQPWGELRRVRRRLVGGRGQPEHVYGYLCPTCTPAATTAGSVGMTALELALFAFLNVRPRVIGAQLVGVKAFAGMPVDTRANAKPWAHVPDLAGLAENIRAA
jgi:hypothetical protein